MKSASNRLLNKQQFPFSGENPMVVDDLRFVASTFVELQEKRHIADYDNGAFWTRTDALALVKSAERAFTLWENIEDERIAQEYLVSLLTKRRE